MIFVAWHLGLGDAIACAAIVAKLAQSGEEVTIPCYVRNEVSVKSFFANYPNVKIDLVHDNTNKYYSFDKSVTSILLGHYNLDIPQLPDEDFVQWFYRQAGMDISEKEEYCPIKEAVAHTSQCARFDFDNLNIFFCHEDRERDFKINKDLIKTERLFEVSAVPKEGSILTYANSLIKAPQVHCIDSSFLHLAEALNVKGKKFYHKYARPNSTDFKYLKGWEVIE